MLDDVKRTEELACCTSSMKQLLKRTSLWKWVRLPRTNVWHLPKGWAHSLIADINPIMSWIERDTGPVRCLHIDKTLTYRNRMIDSAIYFTVDLLYKHHNGSGLHKYQTKSSSNIFMHVYNKQSSYKMLLFSGRNVKWNHHKVQETI